MDYSLRRMTDSDLPAVAEIEAGVFTDWYRIHRREPEALPERTIEELRYATSLDPAGNHVAVAADGALVGFILARTWGKVGWFGTFGVPTQFHGLGIGTALVDRAVGYLTSRCSLVGLETMPESGATLGFYTKAGFAATHPTFIVELSLIREADRFKGATPDEIVSWGELSASGRSRALGEVREISDALLPGLDYSREVEAVHAHGFGKTLLCYGRGERLDGFAVLRTSPFRREDTSGRAFIHALGIRPGASSRDVLGNLVRQVWATATSLGLSRATAGVSTRHQTTPGLLFDNGFRAVRATARMVLLPAIDDIFRPVDTVDISRWAG